MTNHKGQFAPGWYWHWFVKLPPAAREKLVENGGFMPSSTVAGRIVQREQAAIAVAAAA